MPLFPDHYGPANPDIVMDDDFDLHPYGVDGRAISTPGHTPGSVSVLLDSGEAIVGDLIVGGLIFGRQRPRYHGYYSDLNMAKASIAKVIRTAPTRIFVGHGGPLEGNLAARYFGALQHH